MGALLHAHVALQLLVLHPAGDNRIVQFEGHLPLLIELDDPGQSFRAAVQQRIQLEEPLVDEELAPLVRTTLDLQVPE